MMPTFKYFMEWVIPKAFAAGLVDPLQDATICSLLKTITTGLIQVGAAIGGIMLLVGAFQFLFAVGDPKKIEAGKKTILYTVVGYAILVGSSAIVYIIADLLGTGVTPAC